MNFVESCRQLIAIDSSPSNGNVEVANYLSNMANEMGFFVEEHSYHFNGIEQKNIVLRPSKVKDSEELLLLTHLDTHDPGSYSLWTKTMSNPFKASIYGQSIYGLGVAGAKIDFLCKLIAGQKLIRTSLKKSFAIAGTFGEQMGMIGALKLIRHKQVTPRYALVGEATNMRPIYEGAGLVMVEVNIPFSEKEKQYHKMSNKKEGTTTQSKIFRGQTGLGIQPGLKDNAILDMFDYLSQLSDGVVVMSLDGGVSPNTIPDSAFLEIDLIGGFDNSIAKKISDLRCALVNFEEQFAKYPAEGFEPNICTLNIGVVRTFKDYIKVEGTCRILPPVPENVAESWLEELRTACEKVGATFQITLNRRPFATTVESHLLNICQEELKQLQQDPSIQRTILCTEANVLSRLGVETVLIGPGQSLGNIYQPNEVLDLNQAEVAISFYENVLRKCCL